MRPAGPPVGAKYNCPTAPLVCIPVSGYSIDVQVETQYLPGQSEPDEGRYVFAYTITITNTGKLPARLISRHWIIHDATENRQEVHGEGVVGQQPHLAPGEVFRYTSGTVLQTPVGSMQGTYHMLGDDGTAFDADIPAFTLSTPHSLH